MGSHFVYLLFKALYLMRNALKCDEPSNRYSLNVEFKNPVCILSSVDLFAECYAHVNMINLI